MDWNRQNPRSKAEYRTLKNIFYGILLAAVSFIISIVVIEVFIRIALPIYDPSGNVHFYYNSDHVILGVPHFKGHQWKNTGDYNVPFEINVYGLRDHKNLKESKPTDIFVVGDSFAFGFGVREEKRFSDLLQKMIDIPVFNIAIPGDFNDYKLLVNYARQHGAKINRLIVAVCMENDLMIYGTTQTTVEVGTRYQLANIKLYLTKNMAIYNMVTSLIHQNDNMKRIALSLGLIIDNMQGMSKNKYNTAILDSSFRELQKVIAGTDPVILIVPSRGLWVGDNIETESKVHDDFVALLKRSNLPFVDMRSILEAGGNPLQYHFRGDGHWNESGHAKAAEALARHFSAIKPN